MIDPGMVRHFGAAYQRHVSVAVHGLNLLTPSLWPPRRQHESPSHLMHAVQLDYSGATAFPCDAPCPKGQSTKTTCNPCRLQSSNVLLAKSTVQHINAFARVHQCSEQGSKWDQIAPASKTLASANLHCMRLHFRSAPKAKGWACRPRSVSSQAAHA